MHIKKGDESQFLYETTVQANVEDEIKIICNIYNGRLKIDRLCSEIEYLAKAGITLPPNMQGLTDEQITELKLVDEWSNKCTPSGGYFELKDDLGRRNGKGLLAKISNINKQFKLICCFSQVPLSKMVDVLTRTVKDAKEKISKVKKLTLNSFKIAQF